MAAPDNRVPVRLARGTKATLDANIADLYEGEICYATDENICYVKEGSTLEPASGGAASLGGLSDVDLSTAPTDGQTLVWSAVDSAFLPADAGNPVASIDDLTDVDITTVAPVDGQALVWNATDSEFQPGDVATSVAVADLTDYAPPVSYTVYNGVSEFTGTTGGIYYAYGSARLAMNTTDEDGLVLDDSNIAQVDTLVELSTDGGVTWGNGVTVTSQHALPSAGFGFWRFDHDGPADWPANIVGVFETGTDLRLRWSGGAGTLEDGSILTYNSTDSTWVPGPNTPPTVEGLSNTSFGVYAGNTTYVNDATPDANAGEWYMANGTDYIAYNNAQSGAGKMGDLQVGDSVTITYSDDSTETLEVQAAEADNSAGSKFIRFTTAAAAVVTSGGISLSAPGRFGASPGDVLTWNGTAWVSSEVANIAELDSISNVRAKVTSGTAVGRWDVVASGTPAAQGEWRGESYNELRFFLTDADGADASTAFDALPASGSVWIVADSDVAGAFEVTYTSKSNETTYGRLIGTSNDESVNDLYSRIEIYTAQPSEAAPSDGQILSYDAVASEWVVADAASGGGGGSLESLSDTTITAVVPPSEVLSGYWATNDGSFLNVNAAGEWAKYSSPIRVYVHGTDSNAVDLSADFAALSGNTAGRTVTMATDAGFTTDVVTFDLQAAGSSSNGKYYLDFGTGTAQSDWHSNWPTGDLYLKVEDPEVEPSKFLLWDAANNYWADGTPSINDMSDVDTATTPPVSGNVLSYDGTNFVAGGLNTQSVGGAWDPSSESGALGYMRPVHFYEKLPNGNKPSETGGQNQWSVDLERTSGQVWIYVSRQGYGWNEFTTSSDFNIGTPTSGSWYFPLFDDGVLDKDNFNEGDISIGLCIGSRCFSTMRVAELEYVLAGGEEYWGFRLFGANESPNEFLIDWLRSYSDATTGTNAILDDVLPTNLTLLLPMPYQTFNAWSYDSLGQSMPLTGASMKMQTFSDYGNPYWMPNYEGHVKAINGKTNPEPPTYGNIRLGLYDVGLGQDYTVTAGTNVVDGYWDIQRFGGSTGTNNPSAQGEYRLVNANNDDLELLIFPTDMDGVDHAATLTTLAADESDMWVAFVYENVLYGPMKHSNSLGTDGSARRFRIDKALANHLNIGRDAEYLPVAANGDTHIRVMVGTGLEIALKTLTDGQPLVWNSQAQGFMSGEKMISLATLQTEVAASTDFVDFQSRIAGLT